MNDSAYYSVTASATPGYWILRVYASNWDETLITACRATDMQDEIEFLEAEGAVSATDALLKSIGII